MPLIDLCKRGLLMATPHEKRAKTLGRVAVQAQAKRASMNSPWRKQAFCQTQRARQIRAELDAKAQRDD